MIGIYKITSPSGRVYVGQSIDCDRRFKDYFNYGKFKNQTRLYNSFTKYGVGSHKFEVVEECSIDNLNERERYWQEYYDVLCQNRGLNCVYVKTSNKKKVVSFQTRVKQSLAQKGNKNGSGNKGRKNKYKRKPCSDETKLKMSRSHNRHTSIIIFDTFYGVYYNSIKELSDLNNESSTNVRRYLLKIRKNKIYDRYIKC